MLAGLSIVDSLSDNAVLNVGFGLLHLVVLKAARMKAAFYV
jgi:hypothetical protein